MPSLLDLHATIFELALAHATPLSLHGIYPSYHGHGATTALTRTHLAPTQINRQLRREALPIFFRANTFAICLQPVCVKYMVQRKGKWKEIFRRSYGDGVTAGWVATLAEEALQEIKSLRVYVACVMRWGKDGDEVSFERKKCKAYEVAEASTRRMTEHLLYDRCSGRRLFYEVEVEGGRVEGFVETFGGGEEDGEDEDMQDGDDVMGEDECGVCMRTLQRWVDSVNEDEDGEKCVTREKLVGLVWPSGLEPAPGRGDARI